MNNYAIDAYDLATLSREYARWLGAVTQAIQLDAAHNQGRNAHLLANLGQYLADDLTTSMNAEAERIQKAEGLA